MNFTEEIAKAFKSMQDKYIYSDEYRITIEQVRKVLDAIQKKVSVM